MSGNPNTATERLVDEKGRAMLTYSVRRPASAAAASRTTTTGIENASGGNGLSKRPKSAAPRQVSASASDTSVYGRPASARSGAGGSSGAKKAEMGGLLNRSWELAMEQQSGGRAGRPSRSSGALLALSKGGNATADTHSLLDSFVQEATATSSPSTSACGNSNYATDNMGHRGTYQRPPSAAASSLSAGITSRAVASTSRTSRGPVEVDKSLMSRSAFSLNSDDQLSWSSSIGTAGTNMTMTSAAAERSRRRQNRRQGSRRPASAGSLRAATGSWGELRGRGVGLTQLTRARSFARGRVSTRKSAWEWEDNLSALEQQSKRYAGAEITLN
eukprot:COSAG02_NODE_142_length_34188_cov_183.180791_4_plen_331_part_00